MKTPDEIVKDLGYALEKTTPEGKLVDALVIDGDTCMPLAKWLLMAIDW